jgi:CubicO group peptidase (beta-lactamase class C family)
MQNRLRFSACCLAVLTLCLLTSVTAGSSTANQTVYYKTDVNSNLLKPVEISHFFDEAVPAQISSYNIPGAVVVVVRDGDIIFAKGYGYSDIEDGEAVSPNETVFRIGSVSKLFVWTAMLQLEEEGKLDFDEDINRYLEGIVIPDTYPGNSVTLRHLFSHSAGFEERRIGLLARDESGLIPPEQYLSENMPERVYPPGEISSYSNYGAALAGKVVCDVSGMPFEEYARIHIFEPLGMNNSSFRQPLPPDMMKTAATGYSFSDGVFKPGTFEYMQMSPSGAMSSTGMDMGAFMVMLLQNGRFENRTILKPKNAERMQERLFSHDPRIPGWTYGFMERESQGWRVLWHGGDTLYFHSALAIVPELDLGIFVSYNGGSGSGAGISLADGFFGRFYQRPPSVCDGTMPATGELEGIYISSRRSRSTIDKIMLLSGSEEHAITVTRDPDGTLMLDNVPLRRSEDLVFCSPGSGKKAVFKQGAEGEVVWLYLQDHPESAYEKIPFEESPFFQKILLIACEGVFLSVLLLWCGSILFGRETTCHSLPRRKFRPLHLIYALICGMNLLFMVLLFSWLAGKNLIYGVSPILQLILLVPILSAGLTFAGLLSAAYLVSDDRYTRRDRIEFLAISIVGLLFLMWLEFWNLLGWNL